VKLTKDFAAVVLKRSATFFGLNTHKHTHTLSGPTKDQIGEYGSMAPTFYSKLFSHADPKSAKRLAA